MEEIWKIIRKIKSETSTSVNIGCDYKNSLYLDSKVKNSQVSAVEKKLKVKPNGRLYENMNPEHLTIAAEMFIYLNICPSTDSLKFLFQSMVMFYKNLFESQSPSKIILTLNRMMKSNKKKGLLIGKSIDEKLFKKLSTLLSLKYEEIQGILPIPRRELNVSLSSSSGDQENLTLNAEGMYN